MHTHWHTCTHMLHIHSCTQTHTFMHIQMHNLKPWSGIKSFIFLMYANFVLVLEASSLSIMLTRSRMFPAFETYSWISSPFLVLSELWLAGSIQLFWLKLLSKLTDSIRLLSASHWITPSADLHWTQELKSTTFITLTLHRPYSRSLTFGLTPLDPPRADLK